MIFLRFHFEKHIFQDFSDLTTHFFTFIRMPVHEVNGLKYFFSCLLRFNCVFKNFLSHFFFSQTKLLTERAQIDFVQFYY